MSAVLPVALSTAASARRGFRVETLALAACLFVSAVSNRTVWGLVLEGRAGGDPATWWFAAWLFVALTAFHFVFVAAPLTRRNARWLIALLLAVSALASHFVARYGVHLDPAMLRNVLHTDAREAGELLSWTLAWDLSWQAALPIVLLWRVPLAPDRPARAARRRLGWLVGAVALIVVSVLAVFQDLAAVARNHREWRFLVTPANVVYSSLRNARAEASAAAPARQPVGADATLGPSWAGGDKPVLLLLVVGETARAANWGLNGYARQTTPELAALDVVNFREVTACGTDTETSLPCMFSPWGRHDYDERRIRSHESLLHVLDHARLDVSWRDNQSGCKGVCDGLRSERVAGFDEALLERLDAGDAHRVVVLHQIGSHGPAYAARYPREFARFQPACESADLSRCRPAEVVNAYDNSLLYTDHVLARAVHTLQALQRSHDTALVYVSDHGESLGERRLFLHGMPYAIAPSEQTRVPMVMWLSGGFAARFGVDVDCLKHRAERPASHDHLFHSVLGLLDVRSAVYDAAYDVTRECRR